MSLLFKVLFYEWIKRSCTRYPSNLSVYICCIVYSCTFASLIHRSRLRIRKIYIFRLNVPENFLSSYRVKVCNSVWHTKGYTNQTAAMKIMALNSHYNNFHNFQVPICFLKWFDRIFRIPNSQSAFSEETVNNIASIDRQIAKTSCATVFYLFVK